MKYKSDDYYIKKVIAGESRYYAKLVEKHQSMAYTMALRIIKNKEEAEEIAQDAFVKAYQALDTFRGEAKFSTWLYRIIYHQSVSKLRKRKLDTTDLDLEKVDLNANVLNDSLLKYEKEEQKKYLELAINLLNEEESTVINLFYLQESSIKEICEITGLTESNVKIKLHRGRKKLLLELQRILKDELINIL